MREIPCVQGTQEWLDARCGRATASRFKEILTPSTMKLSASAKPYACELIAERLIGTPDPWAGEWQSPDMRRGTYTEHEARKFYELERDLDVKQIGFCIHDNDRWGCSPDGIVDADRGLELKCPAPKTQIKYLIDGELPSEYRAQVHGCMIVTGFTRWDFLSYCVGLPPLLIEVERDRYTETLAATLVDFNALVDELTAKIMADRERAIDAAISRKGDKLALPDNLKALVPPDDDGLYF